MTNIITDLSKELGLTPIIRSVGQDSVGGDAGRGPSDTIAGVSKADRLDREPGPHTYSRYFCERGSGSSGTAYNKLDHEVIDRAQTAGSQVICRATSHNARLICRALNTASEASSGYG